MNGAIRVKGSIFEVQRKISNDSIFRIILPSFTPWTSTKEFISGATNTSTC